MSRSKTPRNIMFIINEFPLLVVVLRLDVVYALFDLADEPARPLVHVRVYHHEVIIDYLKQFQLSQSFLSFFNEFVTH